MRRNIYIGLVVLILIGVIYVIMGFTSKQNQLKAYGLDELTVTDLIEKLENDQLPEEVRASIYHDKMNLYIKNRFYSYDLPENLLYISLAPYYTYTHDCFYHSLTGCRGELVEEELIVRVYDEEDNLLEETVKSTGHDGFVGLFLEKDLAYRIEVEHDGRIESYNIEAYTEQTCYTGVRFK